MIKLSNAPTGAVSASPLKVEQPTETKETPKDTGLTDRQHALLYYNRKRRRERASA